MRIWIIFCTFAAGFDIGAYNDLIALSIMTSKTIYRVFAGTNLFRIEQQTTPEEHQVYVVYNHRKLIGLPFAYDDWMSAVGRVNSLAGRALFDLMGKGSNL